MKRRSFFVFIIICLLIQQRHAKGQPSNLSFDHLTMADGLSDDRIQCILQDQRGFIWIGTGNGLNRYDGHEVKKYFANPFDSLSLQLNEVVQLIEDSAGYIWVFQNGAIHRFDPKTERFEPMDSLMLNGAFIWRKDLSEAMGIEPAIIQFKTRNGQNPIFTISRYFDHSFLERSDKSVWISSPAGMQIFDPATQKMTPFPSSNSPLRDWDFKASQLLFENVDGLIWVKTAQGILRIDPEKELILSVKKDSMENLLGISRFREFSKRILLDDRSKIWMGIEGLQIYDPETSKIAHFRYNQFSLLGLSSDRVSCITEDDKGKIWIGTNDGINIYDPFHPTITHYYHDPSNPRSLPSKEANGALEDGKNGLWIFHPKFISYLNYKTKAYTQNHLYRRNDENKGLWGGGFKDQTGKIYAVEFFPFKILELDTTAKKFFPHKPDSLPFELHPYMRTLPFLDSRGHHYYYPFPTGMVYRAGFYQDTLGMRYYNPISGEFTRPIPDSGNPEASPGNLVNHITEYSLDRSIWISTNGDGLIRYEPESNNFTKYKYDPSKPGSLSQNNPNLLFEDSHGNLWIISGFGGGGMEMVPKKSMELDSFYTIKFSTVNSKLSSNTIRGFSEDGNGNVWVGTELGLFRYNRVNGTFKSFKLSHKKNTRSFVWSFSKGESGRFYLGTNEGLFSFHPDSIRLDSLPPCVYITDFLLDNRSVPIKGSIGDTLKWDSPLEQAVLFTKSVRLPYWQNDFTFDFTAIDFRNAEELVFEYQLENYDNQWKTTNVDFSLATYTNISPGTYVFRVRARNGDGFWNEEGAALTITITPSWYWNLWSKSIYLFLILLFGYFLYRYLLKRELTAAENRRLKELDTLKTRLYTNITHEFRTPLTVISGMANQIEAEPEKWSKEGLQMIRRNSQNLLSLVNQMLDLRRLESGSMKVNMVQADVIPYLKYLLESFHSYAESKDIRVHFISSINECDMDYDPEKLQQIISNLMSNAIKFTKRGGDVYLLVDKNNAPAPSSSSFDLRPSTFDLVIKVKDTGVGIPEEKLPHIFDRFYQVDDTTTGEGDHLRWASSEVREGAGIGLSLAKALVQLLGGQISVQSDWEPASGGKGSEFTVQLPITNQAPPLDQSVEKISGAESAVVQANFKEPLSPLTGKDELPLALIVEDNADVIRYLKSCLENSYQIEVAKDGQEGIEKALELTPDIVLSDVMMPRKDGFQLTEKLKTDIRTSHIPIILLTAKADVESKIIGLKQGADAYLPKPFNQQELLVRMQKLLELRQHLRKHYLLMAAGELPANSIDQTLNEEIMENTFLKKARKIVEKNLTNYDFKVSDFHDQLNMSHSNLHRKLKQLVGLSANEFIHYVRLEKAKKMLCQTDEPVSNIAFDTGYKDPGHFSRVFKKEFGLSPSEYRKKAGSNY
jgi:signal transduction histidine kinase/DNA-binding response OmpR family regulator/ligand-binding sensor domain-containing protein